MNKNNNKKSFLIILVVIALSVISYLFYKEYHEDIKNTDIKEPFTNFLNRLKH